MNERNFDNQSDRELLSLMKDGNQLSFNEIYDRYWERLYAYVYKILNDKWLTEDTLQEVFTNIWVNKEQTNIVNLKSYLFNAVRNRALLKIRGAKLTKMDEQIIKKLSRTPAVDQNFNQKDLEHRVAAAIKVLPARCRSIFYMNKFDHYSIDEIATHYNISRRTVQNQISLALKHLKKELGDSVIVIALLSVV